MSVAVEKHAILVSLKPLFDEAEAKGLWFFHKSSEVGELWCSPEYLRNKQSHDEYVWAPEHWELRSPVDYITALRSKAEGLVEEYNSLAKRLGHQPSLELHETSTEG